MGRKLFVKPIVNKTNNQINVNLKRKDLPKEFLKDLSEFKVQKMKLSLEGWD